MTVSRDELARAAAYMQARFGLPWIAGAMGPAAYDCQGLLRATQRDLFGRDVPLINVDADNMLAVARAAAAHPLRAVWQCHATPQHGDAIMCGRPNAEMHFGTYFANDRGGMWHSVRGAGARFDAISSLEALGYSAITFWRPPQPPADAIARAA